MITPLVFFSNEKNYFDRQSDFSSTLARFLNLSNAFIWIFCTYDRKQKLMLPLHNINDRVISFTSNFVYAILWFLVFLKAKPHILYRVMKENAVFKKCCYINWNDRTKSLKIVIHLLQRSNASTNSRKTPATYQL